MNHFHCIGHVSPFLGSAVLSDGLFHSVVYEVLLCSLFARFREYSNSFWLCFFLYLSYCRQLEGKVFTRPTRCRLIISYNMVFEFNAIWWTYPWRFNFSVGVPWFFPYMYQMVPQPLPPKLWCSSSLYHCMTQAAPSPLLVTSYSRNGPNRHQTINDSFLWAAAWMDHVTTCNLNVIGPTCATFCLENLFIGIPVLEIKPMFLSNIYMSVPIKVCVDHPAEECFGSSSAEQWLASSDQPNIDPAQAGSSFSASGVNQIFH